MSILTAISRFFAGAPTPGRGHPFPAVPTPLPDPQSAIRMYETLRLMYLNNGLYEELQAALYSSGIWHESMKSLRNPANRVVEFHAAKLAPGADLDVAFPIDAKNQRIVEPIRRIWIASNWAAQKQVAARWYATYGDLFAKVVGDAEGQRVYFQLLEAQTVTALETDVRGFLTMVRTDVPLLQPGANGRLEAFWATELWDKQGNRFAKWIHQRGPNADLQLLGTPGIDVELTGEFGIDFVPIVQMKFRDTGDERGSGAFQHAIDKIDEANRMATRLNQMLFRHNSVTWALAANAMGQDGRPLPPPRVGAQEGNAQASDTVTVGDERMVRLPGMSSLTPLVPNLHYGEALAVLQDHMHELEADLPELAYYRLRDLGSQISGRAVRLLLSDAIDRALEARGNFEAGLIRMDQMALTIGQQIGIFPRELGTFEAGDFDHTFEARPVIQTDEFEDAQTDQLKVQTAAVKKTLGISDAQIQRELGYSEKEIAQIAAEREAEAEAAAEAQIRAFERGAVPGVPGGSGLGDQEEE